jgi:hypothetical protein
MPVSSLSTTVPPAIVQSMDSESGLVLNMTMKAVGSAAVSADTSHIVLSIQDVEFRKPAKTVTITPSMLKSFFSEDLNSASSTYTEYIITTDLPFGPNGALYAFSAREHFTNGSQSAVISCPAFQKAGKPNPPSVTLLDKGTLVPGALLDVGKVATTGVKVKVDLTNGNGGSDLKKVYASTTHQSVAGTYTTVDQTAVNLTDDDRVNGFIVFTHDIPFSVKDSTSSTVFFVENTANIDSDPSELIRGSNGLRVEFNVSNPTPLLDASLGSTSEIKVTVAPNFYIEGDTAVKLSLLIRPLGGLTTAPWFSTDSMNLAAPTGTALNKETVYEIKKIANTAGIAMVDIDSNKVYEIVMVLATDNLPTISASVPIYKLGTISQSKNSNIVFGFQPAYILANNVSVLNTDSLVLTKVAPGSSGAGNLVLSGVTYTPSATPSGQSQLWELSSTNDSVKKLIARTLTSFSAITTAADLLTIKALVVPAAEVASSATYALTVTDVLPLSAAALAALPNLKTQKNVTLQSGTYWLALGSPKSSTFKDVIKASEVGKPVFASLNVVKYSASTRSLLLKMEHLSMAEGLTIKTVYVDVADSDAFTSQDLVFVSNLAVGPAVKQLSLSVTNGDPLEYVNLYAFSALGGTTPMDLVDGKKYCARVTYAASQKGFSVTQTSDDFFETCLDPVSSDDGALPAVTGLTAVSNVTDKTVSGVFVVPSNPTGYTVSGIKVYLYGDKVQSGNEVASVTLGSSATTYSFRLTNPQDNNYTVVVVPLFKKTSSLEIKQGSENSILIKFPSKIKIVSLKITKAPHTSSDIISGSEIDGKSSMKVSVTMDDSCASNVDTIIVSMPSSTGNSLSLSRVSNTSVWATTFDAKTGIAYHLFVPSVFAFGTTASGAGWDYAPKNQ